MTSHSKLTRLTQLFTLLSLVFLLGACVNTSSKVEASKVEAKDITTYPIGVQDGTVSVTYYDELLSFMKQNDKYQSTIGDIFASFDENPKLLYSSETEDKMNKSLAEYNDLLIGFNPVGTTEAEKEISLLLADAMEYQLAINTSLKKYMKSKSVWHLIPLTLTADASEEADIKIEEALVKYQIDKVEDKN